MNDSSRKVYDLDKMISDMPELDNLSLVDQFKALGERMSLRLLTIPEPVDVEMLLRNIGTQEDDPVIELPKDAQWISVKCHFTDSQTLSVSYDGKLVGRFGHEALGFSKRNTKDRKPDKQWKLLRSLALFSSYEQGRLINPTVSELSMHLQVAKATLHKRIGILSEKLQSAFNINDSPFKDYDPTSGYELKFPIRPEADLRGRGNLRNSGSKLFE